MFIIRRLLLLALAAGLLAGCAGGGLPFALPEPVEIEFAFLGQESDYRELAERFHELYPNVTVELRPFPPGRSGSISILHSQFSRVDVVRTGVIFLSPDELRLIRPVDEFIAIDKSFDVTDFYPGLLQALQIEQKQMGLPAGVNPMVMFYENERFRVVGVTPPGPDYGLEEFLAAAVAVNQQDEAAAGGNFSAGFCTAPASTDALVFTYLFGGRLFDRLDRPTRPTLDDPANIEAVEWYARLWSEYGVAPPIAAGRNLAFEYLNKSWCGFWMNLYDTSLYFGVNSIEMRMLPLPRARSAFSYAVWDGYFLTQNSKHPQEAWNWMSFLLSRPEASFRQVPPLRSQVNGPAFAQRVSADQLAVARGLTDVQFYHLSEVAAGGRQLRVMDLFSQAVQQVVEDQASAQAALEAAQAEAEKLFGGP